MLQRNASVLWRELDGEAVLLDPAAGCSYNLNSVGTLVWKLLDGTHTLVEIANTVCEHYEVDYEQAVQDIERMLAELSEHHLLLENVPSQHPIA